MTHFLLFQYAGRSLYLDYIRHCSYMAYKSRWQARYSFDTFSRLFYSIKNGTIKLYAKN